MRGFFVYFVHEPLTGRPINFVSFVFVTLALAGLSTPFHPSIYTNLTKKYDVKVRDGEGASGTNTKETKESPGGGGRS